MSIDIQRDLMTVDSKNGDTSDAKDYMLRTGIYASYMESGIYDSIFQQPGAGISAASAVKIAAEQGIPIYTIDQSNLNTILPLLTIDAGAKEDIVNAVNAGKHVIVPQSDISLNSWTGAGYIILDPVTGAGAFMISGGQAGGWSPIDSFNHWGLAGKIILLTLAIALITAIAVLLPEILAILEGLKEIIDEVMVGVIDAIEALSEISEGFSNLIIKIWPDLEANFPLAACLGLAVCTRYKNPKTPPTLSDIYPILVIWALLASTGKCGLLT